MGDTTAIAGEETIIAEFLAPLAAGEPGALGLADDCALIAPPAGFDLVLKTDPVAAGVHFLPDDPPGDIGWKALAVNVSDLVAKGATPMAYLMALSFPEPPTRAWLRAFTAGLAEAQRAFGLGLIGGDTDRRPGPLTVSITVLGRVPAGRMVHRGRARPGLSLAVTGPIGDAHLGLALRRDPGQAAAWGLTEEEAAALVDRYVRPRPNVALAGAVLAHAAAAMDLSDGLLKDLDRMCRASGSGARLLLDAIPLSAPARRLAAREPGLVRKLAGAGDDYCVLAAVAPDRAAAFEADVAAAGSPLSWIGETMAGRGVTLVAGDGTETAADAAGWDHFRPA